jgi:GAF domain-containing protein
VALASASTLSGALEAILGAVLSVEGIDCGGVYLVEDGDLVLKIHRHLSPDFVERTERFGLDDPRTRLVMASTPVFRRWTDLLLPADPIVDGEGLRATAVIPVVHDGKVVGSLNAASHDEDEIQDPARDALQAITSQIGIVTSRLRAEDELCERERFLALLSEITRRTLEAGDVNEWLGTLTDEVAALFGCDACFVTGWNETSRQMVPLAASGHHTANTRAVTPLPGERTITQTALETGLPIVVEEIRSSFAISPRLTHLLPGWSALGLPLFARGQRLGAIVLAWDAPHQSTAREVAAGEQAAAQISLALSHTGFSSGPHRRAATTGPLTGLLGYRELTEIGEREMRRALQFARPFHAVLLQLDQLPVVRSHHGSDAAERDRGTRDRPGSAGVGPRRGGVSRLPSAPDRRPGALVSSARQERSRVVRRPVDHRRICRERPAGRRRREDELAVLEVRGDAEVADDLRHLRHPERRQGIAP